uniref:Uncharacterized protein n=1 Tax=Nelumbo nucifera TaxID=4432 RepID=A0A822XQ71_NELNU|nr:TPA_asm: hypothetical protein HUJ06_023940 [Nelumbo nucifera]
MKPVVPCKRSLLLVIICFFFFFFLSITHAARSMPAKGGSGVHAPRPAERTDHGTHVGEFLAKDNEYQDGTDLVVMDYTPAQKKTPIHN